MSLCNSLLDFSLVNQVSHILIDELTLSHVKQIIRIGMQREVQQIFILALIWIIKIKVKSEKSMPTKEDW